MHFVAVTSDLEHSSAIARCIDRFVCAFCALHLACFCKACVSVLGVCLAISACPNAGCVDCFVCALLPACFCNLCVCVLGVCLAVSACATAGRADYFGNLPNLAARVMALAAPGQVLLEGFQGFGPEVVHKDELTAMLPQQPSNVQGASDYEAVEVLQLGKYPIKASLSPGPRGIENIGTYKPHPFTIPTPIPTPSPRPQTTLPRT